MTSLRQVSVMRTTMNRNGGHYGGRDVNFIIFHALACIELVG